jgi:hypothetical protein
MKGLDESLDPLETVCQAIKQLASGCCRFVVSSPRRRFPAREACTAGHPLGQLRPAVLEFNVLWGPSRSSRRAPKSVERLSMVLAKRGNPLSDVDQRGRKVGRMALVLSLRAER